MKVKDIKKIEQEIAEELKEIEELKEEHECTIKEATTNGKPKGVYRSYGLFLRKGKGCYYLTDKTMESYKFDTLKDAKMVAVKLMKELEYRKQLQSITMALNNDDLTLGYERI